MQVNRMRLIDADKLYDWVRRECNPYGKPTIDFESGNRMLDMIKRSSTAFDKEKVINEIHISAAGMVVNMNVSSSYAEGYIGAAKDIIEIVEKGGIE